MLLGTGTTAVEEDHVVVFEPDRLVELSFQMASVTSADVLAAGEGYEGSLGQMRARSRGPSGRGRSRGRRWRRRSIHRCWLAVRTRDADARFRRSRRGSLRRRGRASSRTHPSGHRVSGRGSVRSLQLMGRRLSEPSCACARGRASRARSCRRRGRCRWVCAWSVFTKPHNRLSRSSASCVPSGATTLREDVDDLLRYRPGLRPRPRSPGCLNSS